jgi:cysteine synthase A
MASILDHIGNTPLVRLRSLVEPAMATVYAKLEGMNPGGSVKDRIAREMIAAAFDSGRIKEGGTVIEATSGNTGIGLALVCAARGLRLILTMSEAMSAERKEMLRAYGAELRLTPSSEGMRGALEEAERIAREHPDYFIPRQFENPANPEAHRRTTGPEIIRALGRVPDAFAAGVGTGGTITGVGEVFRNERPDVYIAAVEPAGSPVLSGGVPGRHRIAGIGAGFFADVLNTAVYDEVITVSDDDAEATARALADREGIFAGVSSGAAVWAALRLAERLGPEKDVVVILPDRGERYLSTGVFGIGA